MPEKYKDEIEEILKQAEGVLSRDSPKPSGPAPSSKKYVLRLPRIGMPRGWGRLSSGKLMLAALSLFLVAIVLAATSGPVMPLVLIGLVLFIAAYAMFFARPGSFRMEKRWRGRPVEDEPSDFWRRLTRWFRS